MKSRSKKFWYCPRTKTVADKLSIGARDCGDWEHWDSKEEFYFYYRVLKPVVDDINQNLAINNKIVLIRQFPVRIATFQVIRKIDWIFDFAVLRIKPKDPLALIEYKGNWVKGDVHGLRILKMQLALLCNSHPSYLEKVLLSCDDEIAKKLKMIEVVPSANTQAQTLAAKKKVHTFLSKGACK